MEVLLIVGVILVIYFLPTIVARHRGKENWLSIFMLNIFVGWTFVGWVIALIWATSVDKRQVA